MPLKTPSAYVSDVTKLSFQKIKEDNALFNALSKALAKGHAKESFDYLNDKNRDTDHLYEKYVKTSVINISSELSNSAKIVCEGPAADKAKAKIVFRGVDTEMQNVFKQNLVTAGLKDNASFKAWVLIQNTPEIKKLAEANAKVAAKKHGIKDVTSLSQALAAMMSEDDAAAIKILDKLATQEKLKEKGSALLKSLSSFGTA